MIAINQEGYTGFGPGYRSKVERAPFRAPDLDIATTSGEVLQAWRLVYRVYLNAGLIKPNPYEIHTTPTTVAGDTVIFLKKHREMVRCTISGIVDSVSGIPLDSVYGKEIDRLRSQGRRVMELGLFAHKNQIDDMESENPVPSKNDRFSRRELTAMMRQGGQALMRLMRPTYWHGIHNDVTDFLIGVHPKHARSYMRAWGFKPCGPERSYAAVNDRPVVLLRLDHAQVAKQTELPYALGYALYNPLPPYPSALRQGVGLPKSCILDEKIVRFLRFRYPDSEVAALEAPPHAI